MQLMHLKNTYVLLLLTALCLCCLCAGKTNNRSPLLDNIADLKDFKKLLRTKTNVLVMFVVSVKEATAEQKVLQETATAVKGVGTLVLIDCAHQERKKLCKKLKVAPAPYTIKHYHNGDYHKDYERQLNVQSMANFMRDPAGELPWEEDPIGADVLHFTDYGSFTKLLRRDARPMLVMFYVPWCGYCKRLKPDYGQAASELKPQGYLMGAMDVERRENMAARKAYNITGFPTILYFESGRLKKMYEGDNNKAALVAFMLDPSAVTSQKTKEPDWSADSDSEIVHLNTQGFEPAIKDEASVLIMFYAPWCGHCKRMKPEWEQAALLMREQEVPGVLAALDATKERDIGSRYNVQGYPTVKYFVRGEFQYDVNVRDAAKIVEFMRDPKEPPAPPPPELPWEEQEANSDVLFLNDENFSTTLKRKKHALVLFYAPWCGHCKHVKPEFAAAATAMRDDARLVFAAIDCTRHASSCQTYSVRGYPTIKYFSYLRTQHDYAGGRKQQDFISYMSNPGAGDSSSTPEPFGNFPGVERILMLSDTNFASLVRQHKRLLVLFYAPWCSHCTQLKSDFAAAAARAPQNVRLAAIDTSVYKQMLDQYKVEVLPTFLLFVDGKQSDQYTGKRKTQDILDYLQASDAHDEL